MVEENARLSRRLSKTLSRASQHAENYGDEVSAQEARIREAEERESKALEQERKAKKKLAEANIENEELKAYIEKIKDSYMEAFENSVSSK